MVRRITPISNLCPYPHLSRRRFGEDSVEKTIDWAVDNVPKDPAPAILEVGAGNGNLLFALCEAGYAPDRICGIDYSEDAVKLATAVGQSRASSNLAEPDEEEDESTTPTVIGADKITFITCDFLREHVPALPGSASENDEAAVWDLVLDKGTLDAIALAEKDEAGRAPADSYPARIGRVVKPGGFFLITCECAVTTGILWGLTW